MRLLPSVWHTAGVHEYYLSGRRNKLQDLNKQTQGIGQYVPASEGFHKDLPLRMTHR